MRGSKIGNLTLAISVYGGVKSLLLVQNMSNTVFPGWRRVDVVAEAYSQAGGCGTTSDVLVCATILCVLAILRVQCGGVSVEVANVS